MEKNEIETAEPHEPVELPVIPTAVQMVDRIKNDVAREGETYRKTHPELARRLVVLLGSIKCGREIYIENRGHEFNIDEVTRCLYGLGYEVKPAHPMVNNPHGAFRILWWPETDSNPFLG